MTLVSRLTSKSVMVAVLLGLSLFVFGQGLFNVQAVELPQCADFIDNDGDGFIDFVPVVGGGGLGPDPDCTDVFDDSEEGDVVTPEEQCELDGGTWNGDSCDFPPTPEEQCEQGGGTWVDGSCEFPPVDVCPNDEGTQTETPCTSDDLCPDDEGIQTETPCPGDENNNEEETPGDGENGGGNDNSDNSNQSSGGGGGGGGVISGPLSVGFVNTNTGGGTVLGTSTESSSAGGELSCTPYLTSYLGLGKKNNSEEVKKLQTFLNTHTDATLPITGLFGPMTFEAVKKFQLDNWAEILAPWVPHGLASDKTATGYVYKTTQRMINKLMCGSVEVPMPVLP